MRRLGIDSAEVLILIAHNVRSRLVLPKNKGNEALVVESSNFESYRKAFGTQPIYNPVALHHQVLMIQFYL